MTLIRGGTGEDDLFVEQVGELSHLAEADGRSPVSVRSEVDGEEQVGDGGGEELDVEADEGPAHEVPGDEAVLDELEEGLHSPARLVEVGDLERGKGEVAGQVLEHATVFSSVEDTSEPQLAAVEVDHVVLENTLLPFFGRDAEGLDDDEADAPLHASDEPGSSVLDGTEEIEADVAAVEDVRASSPDLLAQLLLLAGRGFGESDEGGDVLGDVEGDVGFERIAMVIEPGEEHLGGGVEHGAVHGEQGSRGVFGFAQRNRCVLCNGVEERLGEVKETCVGLALAKTTRECVGQRGSSHDREAKHAANAGGVAERLCDGAQALQPAHLREDQGDDDGRGVESPASVVGLGVESCIGDGALERGKESLYEAGRCARMESGTSQGHGCKLLVVKALQPTLARSKYLSHKHLRSFQIFAQRRKSSGIPRFPHTTSPSAVNPCAQGSKRQASYKRRVPFSQWSEVEATSLNRTSLACTGDGVLSA